MGLQALSYTPALLTPPSAPTGQWRASAGKASGIAAAQIPPEDSSQRRQLQRLGDVLIHADRLGGLYILGKGVGGHGDNRHTLAVIARAAADGAGRVVAIHPRHLNVHERHVVISVGAVSQTIHRLNAVPSAIDRQPAHFQQFCGNLGIELIVLYQQHAPPGLPVARFPVARTDIAPRKKSKTCPTPLDSGAKVWYTIFCRRMNRLVHVVCWLSW